VLLLFVYRSLPALLLGLVPVASGALAGIAAVALGFGAVHGITLGFGVTLIGEAVDYSIYLFVQRGPVWRRTVWPTIRLGVLTSVVGFAALLPSDFQGLAQLGLYSVAGLTAAALVTRFVLPHWLPAGFAIRDLRAAGEGLQRALVQLRAARALLWGVPLLAGAVLYLHRGALLNHELAALSPVSVPDQEFDERLRADLGAPDVRYMVVASAPTREAALSAAQTLSARLAPLVDSGVIAGVESASRYLPPAATQRARQESLPEQTLLAQRLREAVGGLPVSAERLQPFEEAIAAARTAPLLTRADLEGTSFAAAADALLVQGAHGFSALLPVAAVASGDLTDAAVAAVRRVVAAGSEQAVLLNLKGETDQLYSSYLTQAIRLSLAGFAAIVVLLGVALRSAARVARVLTPLALAVAAVAGLLVAAGEALTILHLIGMLLIVAVGSNYALFFDRSSVAEHAAPVALTLVSLLVANLATVLAFGVLAFSRVPVLSDLGATVAPGAALALFFCALLSQPPPAAPGRVA
jgi:predicted exporter